VSAAAGRVGIPFVVAAPSGTGKTTVCQRVVATDPLIEFSVSQTTRPRREGELDGTDYHFVNREEFERLIGEGAFLEWAIYNGNHYGTSWASIEAPLARGHDVLLEIEIQGAAQVRERRTDARSIFLLPPSMKVLEERLRARGTDSGEQIARRLSLARSEVEETSKFDYAVVNEDLERCVAEVLEVIGGEREGRGLELGQRFGASEALERFRSARP
jgi:guanylate kinase